MKHIKVKDGLCVCSLKSPVEGTVSVPKTTKWLLGESILDVLKRVKLKFIKDLYQSKINNLMANYNKFELESFADQRTEWKAWKQDDTIATPIIDTLAAARGIDREVLLDKIGKNVLYIVGLQGEQNSIEDAIKACSTEEELTLLINRSI